MRVLPWCTEGMVIRGVANDIERELPKREGMHKKRAITNSELGEINDERLGVGEVKGTIRSSDGHSGTHLGA